MLSPRCALSLQLNWNLIIFGTSQIVSYLFYDRLYYYRLIMVRPRFTHCAHTGTFVAVFWSALQQLLAYCQYCQTVLIIFQNKFYQIVQYTATCVMPVIGQKQLIFFTHPSIFFTKINNTQLICHSRNQIILHNLTLRWVRVRPINIYTNRGLSLPRLCLYEYFGKLKQYL